MGSLKWLTRNLSPQPIAIHFGSDVTRMMQISCTKKHVLHHAVEVASGDFSGVGEALSSFKGKNCVASIASTDALVQHIRVPLDADEDIIRELLTTHDKRWGDAEIRTVCVTTTGISGNTKHELLCVGIERMFAQQTIEALNSIGIEVVALTVPLYASIRAFDKLYRRNGDGKMTSMLIDMDNPTSMVMIAHGANCVFAHRLESEFAANGVCSQNKQEPPSLISIANSLPNNLERRTENDPRGLCGIDGNNHGIESRFANELEICLRHHDVLFPDRAVERVVFSGCGANDTNFCAEIASQLDISGFIADPSAWITNDDSLASGPSWTTAAGLCMRYAEIAA